MTNKKNNLNLKINKALRSLNNGWQTDTQSMDELA